MECHQVSSKLLCFFFLQQDASGPFGLTAKEQTSKLPLHISLEAPIVQIASGDDHLCMLTIDGDLFTMGNGEQGQLGRVAEIHAMRGGRKGPGTYC